MLGSNQHHQEESEQSEMRKRRTPGAPGAASAASLADKDTPAVCNLSLGRCEQETVGVSFIYSTGTASERTRYWNFILFLSPARADLHNSFVTDPWVSYRNDGREMHPRR